MMLHWLSGQGQRTVLKASSPKCLVSGKTEQLGARTGHTSLSPSICAAMRSLQHRSFSVARHPPQILRAPKAGLLMERGPRETSLQMLHSVTSTTFSLLKVSHSWEIENRTQILWKECQKYTSKLNHHCLS